MGGYFGGWVFLVGGCFCWVGVFGGWVFCWVGCFEKWMILVDGSFCWSEISWWLIVRRV